MRTHANDPISHMTADQDLWCKFIGLTKREYFAVHIMAGDLGSQSEEVGVVTAGYKAHLAQAERAVSLADALIEKLNTN